MSSSRKVGLRLVFCLLLFNLHNILASLFVQRPKISHTSVLSLGKKIDHESLLKTKKDTEITKGDQNNLLNYMKNFGSLENKINPQKQWLEDSLGTAGHFLDPDDEENIELKKKLGIISTNFNSVEDVSESSDPVLDLSFLYDEDKNKKKISNVQWEDLVVPFADDPFDDLVGIATMVGEAAKRRTRSEELKPPPKLYDNLKYKVSLHQTLYQLFLSNITSEELYSEENYGVVQELMRSMATSGVKSIRHDEFLSQLRLILELEDESFVAMKPMRYSREHQTGPNQLFFSDFERHNAEIAAFHVDRLLGFRRAPPVVGRMMNISTEIYVFAKGLFLSTFFVTPDGNLCFYGKCMIYCESWFPICGKPDNLEAAVSVPLANIGFTATYKRENPWRRSYHKRNKKDWENDGATSSFCESVRAQPPYNEGRALLDHVDLSVLDFITGNMDRHHLTFFQIFGDNSVPIHWDNGRAFGRAFHDEMSILAPLYQCCVIRYSTVLTLIRYHKGPKRLSEALRESLDSDPLSPDLMWEPNIIALDRRVAKVLKTIRNCLRKKRNPLQVILSDLHK